MTYSTIVSRALKAEADLAAARRENATLREAISVYVAEVARAAECLGKQMFTDEGYDPTGRGASLDEAWTRTRGPFA